MFQCDKTLCRPSELNHAKRKKYFWTFPPKLNRFFCLTNASFGLFVWEHTVSILNLPLMILQLQIMQLRVNSIDSGLTVRIFGQFFGHFPMVIKGCMVLQMG